MKRNTRAAAVCILIIGVLLSGCDWVDSTGNQGQDESTPATSILLDDIPAGEARVINEEAEELYPVSRLDSTGEAVTYSWSDEPSAQGVLPECADQDGFNDALAAESLLDACALGTECEVTFEPVSNGENSEVSDFRVTAPTLDASVGVTYTLSAEEADGFSTSTDFTFCLIAINQAPDAVDDTFVVEEGAVLNVTADSINLLSNDTDDTDVRNMPLSVLPEPSIAPEFATFFELGTDGSFTYQSSLTDIRVDQFDVFEYEITDGSFTVSATVTIRVVASNQPPEQVTIIPVLQATEDEPFFEDLASRFADPEGSELMFSLDPATPLAEDSGLELDSDGVLSGTPTAVDVGTYSLSIAVSDGTLSTFANVFLAVEAAEVEVVPNTPPEFIEGSVFSQTVLTGASITPVRAGFIDTPDDELTYSLGGSRTLPPGVTLNSATGVISGRPLVIGTFRALRVIATDASGESAQSTAFNLTVISS